MTLDENSDIVSAQDYYLYGEIITDRSFISGVIVNDKYKFTEKERDTETNYDYFGARYYDSELGRWLQVDPLKDIYPDLSPYNYTANNPLRYIDPNGMSYEDLENTAGGVHGRARNNSLLDGQYQDYLKISIDNNFENNGSQKISFKLKSQNRSILGGIRGFPVIVRGQIYGDIIFSDLPKMGREALINVFIFLNNIEVLGKVYFDGSNVSLTQFGQLINKKSLNKRPDASWLLDHNNYYVGSATFLIANKGLFELFIRVNPTIRKGGLGNIPFNRDFSGKTTFMNW